MGDEPAATDLVTDELRQIREKVPGVRGSITATSDGLLFAHDMRGLEPTQVAALVAVTHGVAVRASLSTQCGQLKEVITRGSDGYLAVYAAERNGSPVIVAVLGTTELNVAMLNFQARKMIDRIAEHSAGLVRKPRAGSSAAPAPQEPQEDGREDGGPLPGRRPGGDRPAVS
jgi:predicted regulator of Ras-like GTPase activity (Roadblock/LC7/MglB family)